MTITRLEFDSVIVLLDQNLALAEAIASAHAANAEFVALIERVRNLRRQFMTEVDIVEGEDPVAGETLQCSDCAHRGPAVAFEAAPRLQCPRCASTVFFTVVK